MGKIRVIKSSELGGTSDEPIYPVTSIRAIYDLNNENLEDVLSHKDDRINTVELNIDSLNKNYITVNNTVQEFKNSTTDKLVSHDTRFQGIDYQISNLQSSLNVYKVEGNFLGTLKTQQEATRGATNMSLTICKNNGCYPLFLSEIKNKDILIPESAGNYKIGDQTLTVTDVSIIQKQDDEYVLISLGIPFIPKPESKDIDKTLKVAENLSLYWG